MKPHLTVESFSNIRDETSLISQDVVLLHALEVLLGSLHTFEENGPLHHANKDYLILDVRVYFYKDLDDFKISLFVHSEELPRLF